MSALLSIGDVASATGTTVSALRYYDEIGLVEVATRVGGKRRFDSDTVGRVNFIRRAQAVGFSLDEIGQILDDGAGQWHSLVEAKLNELTGRRSRLDEMIAMLGGIRDCGCEVVAACEQAQEQVLFV